MYSCFGALRGSPKVPDGWYGPPGRRGGRLGQNNVSVANFRAALPYTIKKKLGYRPKVKSVGVRFPLLLGSLGRRSTVCDLSDRTETLKCFLIRFSSPTTNEVV